MIAKVVKQRGKDIGGLVAYLFGKGSANEHRDQRIIAADSILGLPDGLRYLPIPGASWPTAWPRVARLKHLSAYVLPRTLATSAAL